MYSNHVNNINKKGFLSNIIIPLLLMIISVLIISTITNVIGAFVIEQKITSTNPVGLASTISMLLSVILSIILFTKVSKISIKDLGFYKQNYISYYTSGILVAFVAITIVFIPNVFLGSVDTKWSLEISDIIPVIIALLFFIFQGLSEELVFRAYLMPQFSKFLGTPISLILTSLIFMLVHGLNPNMSFMGYMNLFIFGLVFGAAYYKTGNIWIVAAGHSIWNFILGIVYGSNVSGNPMSSSSVFSSPPTHKLNILSGGQYGMEGSIITTIIGIFIIYYFFFIYKKRKNN